jgi:hypothetical protein
MLTAGLLGCVANAPAQTAQADFPPYLRRGFDYANWTRFDALAPPKDWIYQSNGFMALREDGFAGQVVIVPAPVGATPTNTSDRLLAMTIAAPAFVDHSGKTYQMDGSPATRSLTYYADRTVYRAAFNGGPAVSMTVYPVYGISAAVIRIKVDKAGGPLRVVLHIQETGLQLLPAGNSGTRVFGSPKWPYRLLVSARPLATKITGSDWEWEVGPGSEVAALISSGGSEQEAEATLQKVRASRDLWQQATHQAWNDYLASCPLVAPARPVKFTVGTTGQQEAITPEDLVRSELWFWRGVLNTTCQARYMPACPITIADWNVFMGMWGNDGIAEALALAGTGRKDLARSAILNWFRYAVNAKGDGTCAWTMFPSGRNTYQAKGPERETEGVPVQATLVGQYVRMTSDTGILDEVLGGPAGSRTLWQALVAYQQYLPKVRDFNHDHLIDWLHTYETGWDDKNSPFVDNHHSPTSALNEQVFNLWSLEEMVYLCRLRGEDASRWQTEFAAAREAVRTKLWDAATQRYWDLDAGTGRLWTQGENLDAYYFLYYESDPARIAALMKRLRDPAKFNGALLPTLAFDAPQWGGYWRGPAWPRVFSYVALGLAHAGQAQEGFGWLARAINSNLGPLLPENVDPKAYPPGEHARGKVRIMGYDALDCLVFPEVAGLRTWAGEDLTIIPQSALGRVFVRGQKWKGDSFDAYFNPGHPTLIWRNGKRLPPLPGNQTYRAKKTGSDVSFEAVNGQQ